jgi:hypothetical protein
MIQPPRTMEAILHSLGADAEYRDDILGDLAEELAIRAAYDGEAAARRWYHREALRTVPHLVRSWARGFRPNQIVDIVGVAVTSYAIVLLVALCVLGMGRGMLLAFGVPIPSSVFDHPLLFALGIVLGVASSTFAGFVAAWLYDRAPLVAALALGAVWSGVGIIVTGSGRGGPAWYAIAAPIIVLLGTTAGGILRVRSAAVPTADR